MLHVHPTQFRTCAYLENSLETSTSTSTSRARPPSLLNLRSYYKTTRKNSLPGCAERRVRRAYNPHLTPPSIRDIPPTSNRTTAMAPAPQRPFFSNFFAAFRARSQPAFQAKTTTTALASPTGATHTTNPTSTTAAGTSQPRTITTKTTDGPSQNTSTSRTPAATATFSPTSTRYAPPLSRSPGTSSPSGNPNFSMSPPGTSTPLHRGRQRRGSDSSNSSGGFMDALGPDKWYVGGRTAGGEETFYRLGLVTANSGSSGKRVSSLDRLSL